MASWIGPSIILISLDTLVSLASTLLTRRWVGQLGRTFKLGYLRGLHACSSFLGALFHLNQPTCLVSFLESVLVVVFFFFFFSRFRLWYVVTKVTQYVLDIQLNTEELCEIFPHLHNSEIPLKVNQYLIESVNNNEKEIDFVFAVNEIRQQILNTENGSDRPTARVDQQG